METYSGFDDVPVLGAMQPEQAAGKLQELGETEAAEKLTEALARAPATFRSAGGFHWPWSSPRAWEHTAHAFGYLAPAPPGGAPLAIQHAGTIAADETLKNNRIKITLDRLRVADYPGGGMHLVLFDCYAQNQVPGTVEHLHFNTTCRAQEGQHAAVIGYPLFVGLNVGTEGMAFECYTVNVKNDDDEAFLGFLESDAFKEGLKLVKTVQPAIAPFSQMALGLTKAIAKRNRNVGVQEFKMGLDFSTIATRARLAEGSYLAVQIPESMHTVWDWDQWVYDPASGRVVNRDDSTQLIPYNYVIFGVSRYEGD